MAGAGRLIADVAWVSAARMALPKSDCGSRAANRVLPCPATAPTRRRTCWPGVMPSVHTPGCAWAGSLVKARIGMPAGRAAPAAPPVSAAVSGPMISPAPAAIACAAACAAPCAVPPVSRTSSGGAPGPSSASFAALTSAAPRSAFGPVSGARIATPCPGTGPPGAPSGNAPRP